MKKAPFKFILMHDVFHLLLRELNYYIFQFCSRSKVIFKAAVDFNTS